MQNKHQIPTLPLGFYLDSKEAIRQLTLAGRALAELNGVVQKIPNKKALSVCPQHIRSNKHILHKNTTRRHGRKHDQQ